MASSCPGPKTDDVTLDDNLVDLGTGAPTGIGIYLASGGGGHRVAYNTINGLGEASTIGIVALSGTTTIDDNLFLGVSTALLSQTCAGAAHPTELRNNAFVGTTCLLNNGTGTQCQTGSCVATLTAVESVLAGATTAATSDNVGILASCGDSSPRCKPCSAPGAAACVADVMETAPSLATLLSPGFRLASNASCLVKRDGLDLGALVPIDHYGAKRNSARVDRRARRRRRLHALIRCGVRDAALERATGRGLG